MDVLINGEIYIKNGPESFKMDQNHLKWMRKQRI